MPRLLLEAQVQSGTAKAKNAGALFIAVSVSDEEGQPVNDLDDDGTNFAVSRILVPLDPRYYKPLTVTEAVSTDAPGFYILTATPPTSGASDLWQAGENVLSITVQVPPDDGQIHIEVKRGQILATIVIPEH